MQPRQGKGKTDSNNHEQDVEDDAALESLAMLPVPEDKQEVIFALMVAPMGRFGRWPATQSFLHI